jgi:hypothetical protein
VEGAVKRWQGVFFAIFWVCLLVFFVHIYYVGDAVWGDARYYYSYVRSIVLDGDLDLSNDANLLGFPAEKFGGERVVNKFSIGTAVLWLPGFVLVHFLALLLEIFGFGTANGVSLIYQSGVGVMSIGYGVLGLGLLFKLLKSLFSEKIAFFTTVFGLFATNLFFYLAVDPITSHFGAFFLSSLSFYLVFRWRKDKKWWMSLLLGAVVGGSSLVRSQDVILALPVLYIYLLYLEASFSLRKVVLSLASFVLGFGMVFSLQIWTWWHLFGIFGSPYLLLGERFYWLSPELFGSLFSFNHGLIPYSPILLLALFGVRLLSRENVRLALVILFTLLLQWYVVSSWHSWWGGEAYGGRMFISIYPWLFVGLARSYAWALGKFSLVKVFVFSCLVTTINMVTIFWYLLSF